MFLKIWIHFPDISFSQYSSSCPQDLLLFFSFRNFGRETFLTENSGLLPWYLAVIEYRRPQRVFFLAISKSLKPTTSRRKKTPRTFSSRHFACFVSLHSDNFHHRGFAVGNRHVLCQEFKTHHCNIFFNDTWISPSLVRMAELLSTSWALPGRTELVEVPSLPGRCPHGELRRHQ